MKKLFSLLTLAMLTLSAMAATTVTFSIGTDNGSTDSNGTPDVVSKDGVTISCTDAAFNTTQYRFYAGSTTTISSTVGNITGIEFTCTANNTTKYGPGCWSTETGTYSYEGKIGTWSGSATEIVFSATQQVRATQIVVTIDGEAPVVTLADAVFSPVDGTTFNDQLTVTVSCPTENASIYVYDVVDGEVDYTTQRYFLQSGEITINESKSLAAYTTWSDQMTDFVYATYTKVEPAEETTTVNFLPETDRVPEIDFGTADWQTITKDGVTMKFYGSVYKYYTIENGDTTGIEYQYRIYKGRTIQFTTTAGNIRKIEFVTTESNPATGFAEAAGLNEETGIWEGLTRDITFTASDLQVRCTEIIVTLDDEIPTIVVADPVIAPAGCIFVGAQEITITCETEGATILYSINGADYQEYNGVITLTETATVKAYAELNGETSNVVEQVYTKRTEVENIGEANALPNKTDFIFNGNVVVVYQNKSNLWVKDETGYGLIYGSEVDTMAVGATLNPGWTAQFYLFRGAIKEYQYPKNVTASDAELVTIEATEYAEADLTTETINERVIVKGLTLTAGEDAKYLYTADGMAIYNQFDITYPEIEEGKTYDVEGMVSYYNNAVQIMPISVTETEPAEHIRGDVDNDGAVTIGDISALIDFVLNGSYPDVTNESADCDLDGVISIGDISSLIDFLLNGIWPGDE